MMKSSSPSWALIVLIGVWILLKRTRLGMIIRAGVQDRQMVEALGINVRRVFTLVFALGVSLATLGGALSAPSSGLSNAMGESFLLSALIALAIGGSDQLPGCGAGLAAGGHDPAIHHQIWTNWHCHPLHRHCL